MRKRLGFLLLIASACLGLAATKVLAAGFGQNKLHTRELHWQIFETEHFEIHYYPDEEALAREVCTWAETAYDHDTHLLREKPVAKNPLFLYRNQIDFQQTNITPSMIGVGTGGFTEAYKNRVVLPAFDSAKQLREVIFHEFTHALQFNILYGEGFRSFRVYKGYLIPEWIIEGMAEYAAQDWDTTADMVVRDAVFNDYLIPLTLMDGFNHLDNVFLAYKEAQLAMEYIATRFGEEKLASMFKKFKTQISISQILRETVGLGLNEFNRDFMFWVRQKYWIQSQKRDVPGDFAAPLDKFSADRPLTNMGAVWSPDNQYLAWISDRDQTLRIYLKPRAQNAGAYAITQTKFENLALRGWPLTWSPDSRFLAFVGREEGKDRLELLDITTRKLERRDLPLDTFFSPAWSPDGTKVALAGVVGGVGDIYLYDLKTSQLIALTHDRAADDAPAWSPDGKALVYISERDDYWQLQWKDMTEIKEPAVPLSTYPAQHKSPCFSPQGDHLYYTSDRDGIFNLFSMDLSTSESVQLTNVRGGVFQPTVSPDGKKMAFTSYENENYEEYLMPADAKPAKRDVAISETAPEIVDSNLGGAAAKKEAEPNVEVKTMPEILDSRPYRFRFSPDLVFLLAGYDSSQGVVGGGYLTASDYLGDHMVSLVSNIVPGYQSSTQLAYQNATSPVVVTTLLSYQRNYYRLIDLETNTLLDQYNDQAIGGGLQLSKPFSNFDRVETELGLQSLRSEHSDYTLQQHVTSLRLSMVHDSTEFYDFIPSAGQRSNLSFVVADKILGGDVSYTLAQINLQAYQSLDFVNPSLILCARLMAAASLGPQHPQFLFGGIGLLPESATLRGYQYGELLGSQWGVTNFEFRIPLARNLNYSLWPLDFLMLKSIQLAVFDDIGFVANNILDLTSNDVRNSIGLGLRFNTFLLGKELLTIRFDMSRRTNSAADPVYLWGLGQAF